MYSIQPILSIVLETSIGKFPVLHFHAKISYWKSGIINSISNDIVTYQVPQSGQVRRSSALFDDRLCKESPYGNKYGDKSHEVNAVDDASGVGEAIILAALFLLWFYTIYRFYREWHKLNFPTEEYEAKGWNLLDEMSWEVKAKSRRLQNKTPFIGPLKVFHP